MSRVRDLPEIASLEQDDILYAVEESEAGNGDRKVKVSTIKTAVQMTAAEIKTAYESNPDTNAFTDADKTKLDALRSEYVTTVVSGRIVHYTGGQIHYNGVLYVTLAGDILLNANITDAHLYVDIDGSIQQTGSSSPAPNLTFPIAKFSTDASDVLLLEDHRVFVNRNLNSGQLADITTIQPDDAADEGAIGRFADSGHKHAIATAAASTQTPDQSNAEGASTSFARADHIHNIPAGTPITTLSPAISNAKGVAADFALSDHTHAIATALVGDISTIQPDDAAAPGTADTFARGDHKHAIAAAAPSTQNPDQANAEGVSNSFARADHIHNIPADAPTTTLSPATSNSEGVGTSFSRNDHTHAIATALVGDITTIQPDDSAAAGTANTYARGDHRHAIAAAAPSNTGSANSEGASTSFARADHVHNTTVANSVASATADDTTASLTDVAIVGMTLTPAAGTYLATFSSSVVNSGNGASRMFISLYKNAVQTAHSEREIGISGAANVPVHTNAVIQVNGTDTITVQWRAVAGTNTAHERSLTVIRLGD